MAGITLNPKTRALLLQELQNELSKGSRPVVPLSGAELSAHCQNFWRRRALSDGIQRKSGRHVKEEE